MSEQPATTTEPTSTELSELLASLAETRTLLETATQHTRDSAARYTELESRYTVLAARVHDLEVDLRIANQRLDELRPRTYNCRHCGAKIQPSDKRCRLCTKEL